MTIQAGTFGARLKKYRLRAGLTQVQLAKLCGWESQSRISMYERNEREPANEDIQRLCRLLSCTPSDLLGEETATILRQQSSPSAAQQLVTAVSGEFGEPPRNQDEADLLEAWRAWGDEIRAHVRRLMTDTALRGHPALERANNASRVDQERANRILEDGQAKDRARRKRSPPARKPGQKAKRTPRT